MKYDNIILLSDLDGTLLNEKREVSQENIEAIQYFIDNGGRFGIATGRDIENVLVKFAAVPLNFHCIFSNGSVLYDQEKREVLAEMALNQDKIIPFLERCHKEHPEIGIQIHSSEGTVFYPDFSMVAEDIQETHKPFSVRTLEELKKISLRKVLFITPKGDFSWIISESEGLLDVIDRVNSGKNYFEFLPKGSSKGNMVKELRQYCNPKDKIYAVGDFYNDLEMVIEADVGILCETAPEELKKQADFITVSNSQSVISDVVRRIMEL
ncbi:MAG: HAD-IIB family hydrolase [Eubacteriales bacterium]